MIEKILGTYMEVIKKEGDKNGNILISKEIFSERIKIKSEFIELRNFQNLKKKALEYD